MQEYVLNDVKERYYTNDVYVNPASKAGWAQRQAHQGKSMSMFKILPMLCTGVERAGSKKVQVVSVL